MGLLKGSHRRSCTNAGKLVLEEQEFDFYKMMDNVIATHAATVNKKELKLNVYVDEKIPGMLIGDEMRLAARVLNLKL